MKITVYFLLFWILSFNCFCQQSPNKAAKMARQSSEDRLTKLRLQMVEQQISRRGVVNKRVLEAMRQVERHKFVPEQLQQYAYHDEPLPIGLGQTISQPYIVAYMTEALDLKETDRVLEIGTGSGYQAAVLAENLDDFARFGFEVEAFGGRSFTVKSVPARQSPVRDERIVMSSLWDYIAFAISVTQEFIPGLLSLSP